MISVEIEKEIKQENKVISKFTVRQALAFGIAAVITLLFSLIIQPDIDVIVVCGLLLGIIAYYFGFYRKDGIYMEYFVWKKIKCFILNNNFRKYHTKNKYIKLVNTQYITDRNEDLANKQIKKQINRDTKVTNKKRKKSQIKVYK